MPHQVGPATSWWWPWKGVVSARRRLRPEPTQRPACSEPPLTDCALSLTYVTARPDVHHLALV